MLKLMDDFRDQIPPGRRMGTPEEVVADIAFMLSE